jgi:hypothetical protein
MSFPALPLDRLALDLECAMESALYSSVAVVVSQVRREVGLSACPRRGRQNHDSIGAM